MPFFFPSPSVALCASWFILSSMRILDKGLLAFLGFGMLAVVWTASSFPARAAYDYGYPGASHDERTNAFVASQGAGKRWWEHYNIGDTGVDSNLRQAVFSWLEGKRRGTQFNPSGQSAERFQGKSRDELISGAVEHITGPGWWGGASPGPNVAARMYYQYCQDSKVISDSDCRKLLERGTSDDYSFNGLRGVGKQMLDNPNSNAVWCAVANWNWPHLVGAYLYNARIENVGKVTYPNPDPEYRCPPSFSINGRQYEGGREYDALQILSDYLEYRMGGLARSGTDEDLSTSDYFQYQIHAIALLIDFAPHEQIRRKAKMLMDLMVLNHAAGFSSGHLAGGHGRSYTNFEFGGQDSFPYGILFNYIPDPVSRSYVNTGLYVSGYRVPGHTLNFFESINGATRWEGDDYFRIIRGHTGALGDRYDYITPNYTLGGAGFGTGWELNVGAGLRTGAYERIAFNRINLFFCNIPQDSGDAYACGSAPFFGSLRYLFSNGQNGWQHRNALFSKGTPYLHQIGGDNWDVGPESANGWTFYLKGKVAIAIKLGNNSSALEVATLGVDYGSLDEFKNAMARARLTDDEFVTSKGVRIFEGYSDGARPFKRLEIFEGRGNGGEQKVVSWDNNVMTVSKGGSCTYNFNNWTYSGDCGEVRGNIPSPIVLPPDQTRIIPGVKFKIGDRVKVIANPSLKIRSTPSTSGTVLFTKSTGTYGTIVGGPTSADRHVWWLVKYDN